MIQTFRKGDIVKPSSSNKELRKGSYTVVRKMRGFLPKRGIYEVQHEKADYTVSVGGDEIVLVKRPSKLRRLHSGFSTVRCPICSPLRCVKAP